MLVQFMLRNVLSFKKETILDMTAISAYKEHQCNMIDIDTKEKFLRVASIYGANASGKSNIHLAMQYFQKIVAQSINNVQEGKNTAIAKYYQPYSFDNEYSSSEFQIVEILDGFEYTYGFEYDDKNIIAEWLYSKNLETNRTSIILERTKEYIKFGASVRRKCDLFKDQIPSETLVLSFFNKLKLKDNVFKIVYAGIMDTLVVPADFWKDQELFEVALPKVIDYDHDKFMTFLNAIDTGIKDIKYDDSDKDIKFTTYHVGEDGRSYPLNLWFESEGTLKSIMLYIYARAAIKKNRSIFVDELNATLHPLLLKFIVDLFYEECSTAQLIYTTHDTTLMDKKFFRRDQIWFVQKDEYGYSELIALSDYKVRSDASFEKDYLSGVYGGIPLIDEFSMKEGD